MYRDRQRYFIYGPGALKSLSSTRLEEIQVMTFTWPLKDTTVFSTRKLSLSSRREQITFLGISGISLPLKLLLLKNHISLEQRSSGCGMDAPVHAIVPGVCRHGWGNRSHFFSFRAYTPKAPLLKYPKAWDALGSPFSPLLARCCPLKKESLTLSSPHLSIGHQPRIKDFWTPTKGTIQDISV